MSTRCVARAYRGLARKRADQPDAFEEVAIQYVVADGGSVKDNWAMELASTCISRTKRFLDVVDLRASAAAAALFAASGCGGSVKNDSAGMVSSVAVEDASTPFMVFSSGDAAVPDLVGDARANRDAASASTTGDPASCAAAAAAHTYVGCDYWPTIMANSVWNIFDFAVVVANAGSSTASIVLTGPMNTKQVASVAPGQLAKIYLPWVPALKGDEGDNCGGTTAFSSSVLARASAFHLTSTVPVTVYQFNALEYKGSGGPPNKNWSACPGLTTCVDDGKPIGCFSFSNDASLLLPSTAMTGNYRVLGHEGVVVQAPPSRQMVALGSTTTITATSDQTTVTVNVAPSGQVVAGAGIAATAGGQTLTLSLNAGDVAELLSYGGSDLSGSLVNASAPVQVMTGHPCTEVPPNAGTCDHIEESVFPAETLGRDYIVSRPTGPEGVAVPHQVRLYGNFDNTHLTYNPPIPPPGCPTSLKAGEVVECGVGGACPSVVDSRMSYQCGTIDQDFEVSADQPFAVGTFTLGATLVDPTSTGEGDPAQSFSIAVEQYRTKYVFLAPDDYDVSYADVIAPVGATITVDGRAASSTAFQAIGSSAYGVVRVKLGEGQAGAHVLTASQPVGLQIIGYGQYTSYMMPGGLNLAQIAPPPAVPR